MRKITYIFLLIALLLLLAGCGQSFNDPSLAGMYEDGVYKAGFLMGLFQGFTLAFMFLYSLMEPNVHIYTVNHIPFWYDFGFVVGVALFFNGSNYAASSATQKDSKT